VTRALILPGLHDSDPGHWQSRWEARDETLLRVIQDDWETPHCADWIARLDQAVSLSGPDTVLVAHSAGLEIVAASLRRRASGGVAACRHGDTRQGGHALP
jgi:predicted alpha/beta hydrolase family esterase